MSSQGLTPSTLVSHVLSTYPQTEQVFNKWNVACVGCWLTDEHTIQEVAQIYNLDLYAFLRDLREAIGERAKGPERA
jgi:hybrid cluster-associated redox disulfide protein